MCRQSYRACINRTCPGFAELGLIFPCEHRPNCEIEYVRIPRIAGITETHCPNCRGLTKKERNRQTAMARKAKKDLAQGPQPQKNKTNGAVQYAPWGVTYEAGSSTMVASKDAVGGDAVGGDAVGGDLGPCGIIPDAPWEPFFTPESNQLFERNWVWEWQNRQFGTNREPTPTHTQPNVSSIPQAPVEPVVRHIDDMHLRREDSTENSEIQRDMGDSHKPDSEGPHVKKEN